MTDEFESFFERNREPESRVHRELTQRSRERIAHALTATDFDVGAALEPVIRVAGTSGIPDEVVEAIKTETSTCGLSGNNKLHEKILLESDSDIALSYLEHLFIVQVEKYDRNNQWMGSHFETLCDIIETEGLLWQVREVPENEPGTIRFESLASDAMKDVDEQVRSLAADKQWSTALRGYNDAYEQYLDGDYDELIAKRLYNSVEDVLRTICVDKEGWTDNPDLNHSDYLNMLREEGVYNANGITAPELNNLLQGLEQLTAKLGNDRKQRHSYMDRTYCTLLIHQVGAFLYFLINRYEQYSQ
ncbi:hypothetical protein [Halomarina ordinaria]|uniref:Abortive infection protein-like C-terminal domain-containing protein n=1 Tax=Halomarina ordinaria TaxID=3033939 RepID=A0ABD5U8K9_9EURY|nr:hypothetical protein [Halomarina sp. PSRA2]